MEMLLRLFTIALLASLAMSARNVDDNIEEERIFNQYLRKFGLQARETDDLKTWKQNVLEKFKKIEEHNKAFRKGEKLFEMEVNHLSHLSEDEFVDTLIKHEKPDKLVEELPIVSADDLKDLPDYWNWVDKGVIQDVQNQHRCGSCYVFATIAAIEAHSCLYNGICEKLSEQEGMECSINGCHGGRDEFIYSYTQLKNGATYGNYTYQGQVVNDCDAADARPRVKGTKVLKWKRAPNDAESIRYYLYKHGPLATPMDIIGDFKHYKRGIYSEAEGPVKGGHLVLLVGYGTENGTNYFTYRNSWGTHFGESGYFRAIRGINIANLEGRNPSFPVMESV